MCRGSQVVLQRYSGVVACLVMNEPLIRWLMAPDAPEVPLTLEGFHRRPEWQQDAACRGQGVRAWFPGAPEQLDRARAVWGLCGP